MDDPVGELEEDTRGSVLDIYGHRREMAEYEAGYQAVLGEENDNLKRKLAEEEASQKSTPQRPGS